MRHNLLLLSLAASAAAATVPASGSRPPLEEIATTGQRVAVPSLHLNKNAQQQQKEALLLNNLHSSQAAAKGLQRLRPAALLALTSLVLAVVAVIFGVLQCYRALNQAVVDCDVQPLPFENVMLLRRCSWSGTAVVTALLWLWCCFCAVVLVTVLRPRRNVLAEAVLFVPACELLLFLPPFLTFFSPAFFSFAVSSACVIFYLCFPFLISPAVVHIGILVLSHLSMSLCCFLYLTITLNLQGITADCVGLCRKYVDDIHGGRLV
ncbi:hypothetical protein, conserved [Eimeria necatrix]|uniref:Transmembrane protein n=1 Tax=Eimeria necatrix TaxID=51315 RepID=U6N8Z3_9EIME|nr:hypothetical protein, conserved [Eimeria necatrix]CDJ70341.1 hypothetical protein, conserved [Eimeria necatrix]